MYVNAFVLGMIPMVALLILLGYWFELRRLPKDTGVPPSDNRRQDMRIAKRLPLQMLLCNRRRFIV